MEAIEEGLECPHCKAKSGTKAIAVAMPMKICHNCGTLWGEPFASIYAYVFAPIEGIFNGGFMFMSYEGSYWKALIQWFKGW